MKSTDIQVLNTNEYPYGKKKAVCFTFDDCQRNSLRIAIILKLRCIHATFFLNTKQIIDNFHYRRCRILRWMGFDLGSYRWQYHILRWMGFELGSHTRSHKLLTSLDDDGIDNELQGSKQDLINVYGVVPAVFSYPYSKSTPETDVHVLKWFLGVRYNTIIDGQQCYHIRTKTTADDYKNLTDKFVNGEHKALIIGGHGVDGKGYEPILSKNLRSWTNSLKQYNDRIWFASFGELVMYETIKNKIECQVEENAIFINTSKIDDILKKYPNTPCLYPVTVQVGEKKKTYTVDIRKHKMITL